MENQESKAVALPGPNNLEFIERLYEEYLRNPSSVPTNWQRYFASLADGDLNLRQPRFTPSFKPFSIFNPPNPEMGMTRPLVPSMETAALHDRVYMLIRL